MEFRAMDLSNNFPGRNEFRFVDLRTLSIAGRNVRRIDTSNPTIQASVVNDGSRGRLPYTQGFQDINGNFILENTDPGEVPLNSDYAHVSFTLNAPKVDGNVYVIGRFNNWKLEDENLMRYDERNQSYQTSILLKQGYYEYLYHLDSPNKPDYYFEGSHFLTENTYEIFVYYRKAEKVIDELVGYKKFNSLFQ